jgi:hypothetical protein
LLDRSTAHILRGDLLDALPGGAFIFSPATLIAEPPAIAATATATAEAVHGLSARSAATSRWSRMTLTRIALALVALAATLDWMLLVARGPSSPAWAHWWCSPSALHATPRVAGGGLAATLLDSLRTIAPHWPHILPILLALVTLVYLRRADARYHAHDVLSQPIRLGAR